MSLSQERRLTFHKRSQPASDFLASDEQATAVCEVFGLLVPKSGNEPNSGDKQLGVGLFTIRTRWGVAIAACDSSWWATWTDPVTGEAWRMNFVDVRNVGGRNREVEIDAVRVF